jgi:hypothetical protein
LNRVLIAILLLAVMQACAAPAPPPEISTYADAARILGLPAPPAGAPQEEDRSEPIPASLYGEWQGLYDDGEQKLRLVFRLGPQVSLEIAEPGGRRIPGEARFIEGEVLAIFGNLILNAKPSADGRTLTGDFGTGIIRFPIRLEREARAT